MNDLEIAENELKTKGLTLVIVKKGELIFKTKDHKIAGFLSAIEKFGRSLEDSSIADRVVGKAIALLCVYAKVKAIYAVVISTKAKKVLEQNQISHEWTSIVNEILDSETNQVCPFEMKAISMSDPEDTYFELRNLLNSLKDCKQS
ncbi:DUF1893 domain-containing protein [Candidatus Bathyarchaeota archaeon]|nr:DUF1893 domain-containing protein [Candidatus Bathyarchaeota archaeon]